MSKRLLTVFGSTGNQGGSVIDVVLSRPQLAETYALRGITRDPSSRKSKALADKGVAMVKAQLNDPESLRSAVRGSYAVFGVTDFWAVLSKDIEVSQGKNIFEACKSEGVKHLVWSSLPNATELTHGELKHVTHFDSKAAVAEYAEANKGDMIMSYCRPAMFITFADTMVKEVNGKLAISLPFPDETIALPLLEPRRDTGKWVLGLFEGEKKADGVAVHGVSTWTTPKEVVDELSKQSGKEVVFNCISAEVYAGFLPENIREELTEMMVLLGKYNYFGKGSEKVQGESDKWLVEDADLIDWPRFVKESGVAGRI